MKAVRIHGFGDEKVMRYDDVEIPQPGPREMLVRVHATSINHSDLVMRQNGNIHIGPQDLPLVLGRELSGEVVAVGSNVHEYAPGQRVAALPAVQTRAAGMPGGKEFTGCYAEYALVRPQDARPLPDGIDMILAGAAPWVSLTAWHVLQAGKLQAGERVLLQSGGSGMGMMGIVIAKQLGAEVFTTAGTDEKCERLRALGADLVVNYRTEDFEAAIVKHTCGKGIDLVIETLGGEAYHKGLKLLAPGGRLIALGSLSGGSPSLLQDAPPGRTARRFSITATLMESPEAIKKLDDLFALIREKNVPIVDRVFPLAEAAAAHRYIADRRNFGKVALIPPAFMPPS